MYCLKCKPMCKMIPEKGGYVCPDCNNDVDANGYKREKTAIHNLPECPHEMMPEPGCEVCDAWIKEHSRDR